MARSMGAADEPGNTKRQQDPRHASYQNLTDTITTGSSAHKVAQLRSIVHTYIYIHTHIHTYIHTYIYTYIQRCIDEDQRIVHLYLHMYVCMYIYILVCIYTSMYIAATSTYPGPSALKTRQTGPRQAMCKTPAPLLRSCGLLSISSTAPVKFPYPE